MEIRKQIEEMLVKQVASGQMKNLLPLLWNYAVCADATSQVVKTDPVCAHRTEKVKYFQSTTPSLLPSLLKV